MAEYSGYDVTLEIDNTGYTSIAQVRDISGPSMNTDTIEVTHRDGNNMREYVAGLRDGGEVTFDIIYDPDDSTHGQGAAPGLVYHWENGTLATFKLSFADATPTTITFTGIVTNFEPKGPMNDAQTADVTIKVSGSLTWA